MIKKTDQQHAISYNERSKCSDNPYSKQKKKSSCLYLFRTRVLKRGSYTDDHIDSPPVFLRVKKHFINMKKKIQS